MFLSSRQNGRVFQPNAAGCAGPRWSEFGASSEAASVPGVAALDALLAAASVRCVAVDRAQALAAREAYARYSKGRSPAGLNFGDCFTYALAQANHRPLLFKGDDFGQTDIDCAGT